MELMEYMQRYGYEQLVACHEPSVGLRAFIAIHDTTLGPACGGVRIWPHSSEDNAIMDVLRLARAMTYKSALAGLPLGVGKALIWADSRKDKSEALLRAFGRFVDTLGGRYVTTEDVGMTPFDLAHIARKTEHVVGLPASMGGSGDTSTMTGLGVYLGMKAGAVAAWGSDSLEGRVVAIQGFGNMGANTARHLLEEGAQLVVADTYRPALDRARESAPPSSSPRPSTTRLATSSLPVPWPACSTATPFPGCAAPSWPAAPTTSTWRRGTATRWNAAASYTRRTSSSTPTASSTRPTSWTACTGRSGPGRSPSASSTTERVIHLSRREEVPTYVAANRLAEQRLEAVRGLRPIYR